MDTFGRHLLVEYRGCDRDVLNDIDAIEVAMRRAAQAANTELVRAVFHPFEPHGVSGVVVIMESHLSIHTWPEHGYAAVDFFTCGEETSPDAAHEWLARALDADDFEVMVVHRGLTVDQPGGMRVVRHVNAEPTAATQAQDSSPERH